MRSFQYRLSKCGGFLASLKLAPICKKHGLGYQLGSRSARRQSSRRRATLCFERQGHSLPRSSYDKHLVREALATKDITFGWGGWAHALPGPGSASRSIRRT